jgi:PAS domain S-box-containing protein
LANGGFRKTEVRQRTKRAPDDISLSYCAVAGVTVSAGAGALGRKGLEAPYDRRPAERALSNSVHAAGKERRVVSFDLPGWLVFLVIAPLTIASSALGEYAISENWLRPGVALAVVTVSALLLFVLVLFWSGRLLKLRTNQRDHASEALEESESRLRLAQSAASIATLDWDFVTVRAIWSSNFEQIFGVSREAVARASSYEAFLALVYPDDKPSIDAMLLRLLKSGGVFSEEFRIVKPDGAVCWIATRGEVICDHKGRPRRLIGSNFDITEQRAGEERLRRSLSIIALAIEAGETGVWTANLAARTSVCDERARAIFDLADGDGIDFELLGSRVHPGDRERVAAVFAAALKSGEKFTLECRILRRDGVVRWVSIRGKAEQEPLTGQATTMAGIVLDVTERRERETHLQGLLRELSHRSKNLLAVIQAMARQTATGSSSIADFQERFAARLQALAASHDLLVAADWHGASMADIAHSQIDYFLDPRASRIKIDGSPLLLRPDAAQNIGLALHELSANAVKYGALANATGTIDLFWNLPPGEPGARQLRIVWRESGGPPVETPKARGFGRAVIERVVAQALEGEAAVDFQPSGLTWTLEIPDRHILSHG